MVDRGELARARRRVRARRAGCEPAPARAGLEPRPRSSSAWTATGGSASSAPGARRRRARRRCATRCAGCAMAELREGVWVPARQPAARVGARPRRGSVADAQCEWWRAGPTTTRRRSRPSCSIRERGPTRARTAARRASTRRPRRSIRGDGATHRRRVRGRRGRARARPRRSAAARRALRPRDVARRRAARTAYARVPGARSGRASVTGSAAAERRLAVRDEPSLPTSCSPTRPRAARRGRAAAPHPPHPELGLELPRTQAAVLDALDGLGLDVRTGDVGRRRWSPTCTGGRPGPTILLRADMDALPMPEDTGARVRERRSTAHARVRSRRARRDARRRGAAARRAARELPGTVRFMFQPGEEGFHGARLHDRRGPARRPARRRRVRAARRAEPAVGIDLDARRRAHGVGRRASRSRSPARAVTRRRRTSRNDPMPVAAEIVQALQVMVTRRINTFDPVVVTITKIRAGTTNNVIPESVAHAGHAARGVGARPPARDRGHRARRRGHRRRARDAAPTSTSSPATRSTVNDDAFAGFALEVAAELLGARTAGRMPAPGHGRRGLLVRAAAAPGRAGVPRRVPARRATGATRTRATRTA